MKSVYWAYLLFLYAAAAVAPALAQERCVAEGSSKICRAHEVCVVEDLGVIEGLEDWGDFGAIVMCKGAISESITTTDCLTSYVKKPLSNTCTVKWNGPITQASVDRLVKLLDTMPDDDREVSLNIRSTGGDVRAAMQLGRELRQRTAEVIPDYCASACVLIVAGAPRRWVNLGGYPGVDRAQIVIHRPYSLDLDTSDIRTAQAHYDQVRSEVAAYLKEMNVPVSLLEAMLTIPPESGRMLGREELQNFHLYDHDPVYQQMMNAKMAKYHGLSMSEYLRRKGLQNRCRNQYGATSRHCSQIMDTGAYPK